MLGIRPSTSLIQHKAEKQALASTYRSLTLISHQQVDRLHVCLYVSEHSGTVSKQASSNSAAQSVNWHMQRRSRHALTPLYHYMQQHASRTQLSTEAGLHPSS